VISSRHFVPLGWSITKATWNDVIRPIWFSDSRGWDFSVNAAIESHSTFEILVPELSRSNHIGREGGVHCSAQFHDAVFGNLIHGKEKSSGFFLDPYN
jgi:hypothetical protein